MRNKLITIIILAALLAGCAPSPAPVDIQPLVDAAVAQTMEAQQQVADSVAQTVAAQAPLPMPAVLTPTTIPISLQFTATAILPTSTPSTSSFKSNPNIPDTLEPPVPGLTLTVSSDHLSPIAYEKVGEVIKYTYKLKNTGNVTLSGPITVSDDKATLDESCDPRDVLSLAPQTSIICAGSYTITRDDIDNVQVTNTATGQANFNGTAVASKPVTLTVYSADVTAVQVPQQYACNVFTITPDLREEVEAGSQFKIKWMIINSGARPWDAGVDVKYSAGTKMTAATSVEIPNIMNPGDSYTVVLNATAPAQKGRYYMTWMVEGQLCYPSVIIDSK